MDKGPIVLGITTGHGDSSAALIINGKLVAAVEEERFNRLKHCASFPEKAIQYCLRHGGIGPREVTRIAIARKPGAHRVRKFLFWWNHTAALKRRSHRKNEGPSLSQNLRKLGIVAGIYRVEHHFAHLMSSRILCPTVDAALLSFDGLGDFVSASIGRPQGELVHVTDRVFFPHSLGYFYTAMTQYLGFPYFGDEYKVMGLSSYGSPKYLPAIRELIREENGSFGFTLNGEAFPIEGLVGSFRIENDQPKTLPFYNSNLLVQLIGVPPRKPKDPITSAHWDLAKSVQARFEEIANHLLRQLHEKHPSETLGLSGGCAHNSVWVGKVPKVSPFKNIYVAPAAHDAGIAVGAAAAISQTHITVEGDHWGLLGPSPEEVEDGFDREGSNFEELSFGSEDKLIDWMVKALCEKKVLGLIHGRLEFGPRALGSRSILADPRWPDMKERLNRRVKHRESFRPFAASVLAEEQTSWFVDPFYCPHMEAVFEVKQPGKIPAVTHVDNTCRIQSVTSETQPFYYKLIEAFRKKTGVPMLLNTSFNDSEPIVCSERDAWRCFLSTDLDALVLRGRVYVKRAESATLSA